jgi:Fe-S-cluster containining protein
MPSHGTDGDPWYADGLRFRCTACGQCCTGEPGHVWVTPAEVRRIAKARGLSTRAFQKRFVVRVGKRLSLRELENGDCAMLKDGRCTVYRAKPLRCTTYPFWPVLVESEKDWREEASRCEGIGQGDRYARDEIEQVIAGDPGPLLRKHARDPEQPVYSKHNRAYPSPPAREPDWDGAFAALEALYEELDEELPRWEFTCSASGNCCDFDAWDHRLYASTVEAEYFFRRAPSGRANDDPRQCPAWGTDRLCKARAGRMLGCRTYYCPPYPRGVPEDLHDRYDARIKALHEAHAIPYAYRDIVQWAAERRPAASGAPRPPTSG